MSQIPPYIESQVLFLDIIGVWGNIQKIIEPLWVIIRLTERVLGAEQRDYRYGPGRIAIQAIGVTMPFDQAHGSYFFGQIADNHLGIGGPL